MLLCCEVSHKVLRTDTVYDQIQDIARRDGTNYRRSCEKALLGTICLTKYNNRTYKIDDVDFDQNPLSTFINCHGQEESFVSYYQKNYGQQIKDHKQPLLIHRPKRKTVEEEESGKLIALVPELCNMTGLTESMKSDFKVMKDVAMFTRITPSQRQVAMQKFLDNVADSAEASAHLLNWGLRFVQFTLCY